ncbi:hypothetical protein E2C01_062439 [Portunus trituberculatus]|uniref:Uncharacterized protein n=1 Tax=Portunus trituberculatus TaxID=210409 RepID=A0A5B7H6F9_PORTR|nr:hypothetical protein [Portunus trituberculatus]
MTPSLTTPPTHPDMPPHTPQHSLHSSLHHMRPLRSCYKSALTSRTLQKAGSCVVPIRWSGWGRYSVTATPALIIKSPALDL